LRALGWPLQSAKEQILKRRHVVDWADCYVQSVEEFMKVYDAARESQQS
jgi:hypothetical protein